MLNLSSRLILICTLALATLTYTGCAQAKGFKVLYAFTGGSDGASPQSSLIVDHNGNLYGTTRKGGDLPCGYQNSGCGTVFRLSPDGTETVLYAFGSGYQYDGQDPGESPVVMDKAGNLYGTTSGGGANAVGTAFKVSPDGTETILYSFGSQANYVDGAGPFTGLIPDGSGGFYGTAGGGNGTTCHGGGCGVVFTLTKVGTESVLYSFKGGKDGSYPNAVMETNGTLYGTTFGSDIQSDYGTVYKLALDGTETVLHRFCRKTNCTDGAYPEGGVIMDKSGYLYGTAHVCCYTNGSWMWGLVFKLAQDGKYTVLYTFTGGSDGGAPSATLIEDSTGNLYSTTAEGGVNNCFGYGCGTVFKLAPDGSEKALYVFSGGSDGSYPFDALIFADKERHLIGTNRGDFSTGYGVVFELSK